MVLPSSPASRDIDVGRARMALFWLLAATKMNSPQFRSFPVVKVVVTDQCTPNPGLFCHPRFFLRDFIDLTNPTMSPETISMLH